VKKLFAILFVALVSSVMTVGCGGDKPKPTGGTPSGAAPATPAATPAK
jgi:hypothetical protein